MRTPTRFPLVLLAAGGLSGAVPGQLSASDPALLEVGKTVQSELSAGQSAEYRLRLRTGYYFRVTVEQRTIDVRVTVFGPDGNQRFTGDTFGIGNDEPVEWIADAPGDYRLRVTAKKWAAAGQVDVTLREAESATERHKSRVAAVLAVARATTLAAGKREDWLKWVSAMEEALAHWRAAGDRFEQARALYSIGLGYIPLGDRRRALEFTAQALPVARASGDRRVEAWALTSIGQVLNEFDDKRKAVEYFIQALPLMRAAADRAGEGFTMNLLGSAYLRLGEKRKAVSYFEGAAQASREVQDRNVHAAAVNNLGAAFEQLGDRQRSLEYYQQALTVRREIGNRSGEAQTLSNMALVRLNLGEYQKALEELAAALNINRTMDYSSGVAVNLNNIARVYSALGDRERALRYFEESLGILRAIKDQWGQAHVLDNIGEIHAESGEHRKALTFHNEALSFARAVGDRDAEASALNHIGNCYAKLGDPDKARKHFEQALAIHRSAGNSRLLASTLRNLGALQREAGSYQTAAEYLNEALELSRAIRDKRNEAAALSDIARLESRRGDYLRAHKRSEEAISAFESLRLGVVSPKLRALLFASAREVQELNIEMIARLHVQHPAKGFDAAGLLAAERGRARSLLELLSESKVEIRHGVAAALLNRERELERLISDKAEQQVGLLNGKHTDEETAAMARDLDILATELEQVQSRIRQASPAYAALTQPAPLDLAAIQTQVLDQDTVLLEYALGTQKSLLWAVTPSSLEAFELPPRAEIESTAKHVYELLTVRNQKTPKETPAARAGRVRRADEAYSAAAADASRMLLGPVASRIRNKRLLVVGEGVLQYLPFSALPEPVAHDARKPDPLIASHEIVTAPSASVLAVLRQETAGRKAADKGVLVLADAVFSGDDPRVVGQERTPAAATASGGEARAAAAGQDFVRLRFSRAEAEEIARLAPESTIKVLDFDASRDAVLKPDLTRYRVIHFATHGLVNNRHPELSGVVLSLVDRAGNPQNGFVSLYDIYNLRLRASMVVLSACQTGLGGEIRGEGLIGLTRGFLYAGAPRVVATLWAIDDRTTAELMKRFYEGILARGERPAAALRAAQAAMWKAKGWSTPYYWAAFSLAGEWR